ncbi:c-type cytochrome [Aliagarivorans taiwanensis]|uniref:c-type cytochrome n=1 Tax=Aliagarivorans taiwanensis TaxID=561966 RepID=UPI000422F310|nr:c-type cytochrome [Aliagarivorans taiwanensis]
MRLVSLSVLAGALIACSDDALEQAAVDYQQNCKACHAQGISGAPIVGNSKMWQSRQQQGLETLAQHAIEGYGLMPARGGSQLNDQQIEQVIRYMLKQLPD